jgi:hypothetical protein
VRSARRRTDKPAGKRCWRRALATSALLALAGCGALHPGAAAVVGSGTISHEAVADVAEALCAANASSAKAAGRPVQAVASKGARAAALQVLLESRLSHLFGERRGVHPDPRMVAQAVAQSSAGLQLLPPEDRHALRAAVRAYAEGQSILLRIGRRSLQQQGKQPVTAQEALAEGQRLRGEVLQSIDVEVDPRYGSYTQGQLQAGDSDLSVATSDAARQASLAQPSASYLAGLPASQKCG